ncbi:hypothetical protein DFA_11747 [Cavenderia fasciculata]|uniref:FNIP repeat-containing protein n=1 Tax=Cavenderia fasciculata TaxID=261658 RepID=F4QE39_CACFS|nr:uncharacterized protein DFA_11747 [Cavenderia fasciculata]EGG13986.1 hypothetical protein DFA_11747 [Cavenderia fasciculata]|eukprot:XP_004350694.1 hypothetical protein DFA_11747 [Cavenderia fasciculata]
MLQRLFRRFGNENNTGGDNDHQKPVVGGDNLTELSDYLLFSNIANQDILDDIDRICLVMTCKKLWEKKGMLVFQKIHCQRGDTIPLCYLHSFSNLQTQSKQSNTIFTITQPNNFTDLVDQLATINNNNQNNNNNDNQNNIDNNINIKLIANIKSIVNYPDNYKLPSTIKQVDYLQVIYYPSLLDILPLELTSLTISFDFGFEIDNLFTKLVHLETLRLVGRFNREIKPGHLPNSIRTLQLGDAFNKPLVQDSLPSNIEHLSIGASYQVKGLMEILPSTIKSLTYGVYNYMEITPNSLPNGIESLSMSATIGLDNRWEDFNFPPTIRHLFIDCYHHDNRPNLKTLPRGIIDLELGPLIDVEIPEGALPPNLLRLKLGACFRQTLQPRSLPSQLTHLVIGDLFDCPINPGVLPDTIISLTLPASYKMKISIDALPSGIELIQFLPPVKKNEYIDEKKAILRSLSRPFSEFQALFGTTTDSDQLKSLAEKCPNLSVCVWTVYRLATWHRYFSVTMPIKNFATVSFDSNNTINLNNLKLFRMIELQRHQIIQTNNVKYFQLFIRLIGSNSLLFYNNTQLYNGIINVKQFNNSSHGRELDKLLSIIVNLMSDDYCWNPLFQSNLLLPKEKKKKDGEQN